MDKLPGRDGRAAFGQIAGARLKAVAGGRMRGVKERQSVGTRTKFLLMHAGAGKSREFGGSAPKPPPGVTGSPRTPPNVGAFVLTNWSGGVQGAP